MKNFVVMGVGKESTKTVLYGLVVLILYFLLYVLEEPLLRLSSLGRWYFIVPIALAFIFSLAHGVFTSRFWAILGIKAKKLE